MKSDGASRNGQVVRILHVIRVLERHPQGISAAYAHAVLVDEGFTEGIRTIYRDLAAIQEAHFPLESFDDDQGEKKWRFNSVATVGGKIQISYEEIIALYISKECLEPLKGTSFFKDIQSFFDKVEKLLGPKVQAELRDLAQTYSFRASPMWTTGIPQEVLDVVHRACIEGHEISIEYRSNNSSATNRRIGPLGIYLADSSIYLIAKDLADGIVKKFALVRIRSAHWTETAFENGQPFSIEDFYKDDFGVLSSGEVAEVTIRITEPIASYVAERRWHHSQRTTRLNETMIELKLKVKINQELARWVLSLGPSAEVLSPSNLESEVLKLADGVAQTYRRRTAA
ncbi:MAG: WYL domain-containing protein [Deltaproteobacteria bacterium]|nr:WYL domain-containing protein [Deltaproteobacteria bacterium]